MSAARETALRAPRLLAPLALLLAALTLAACDGDGDNGDDAEATPTPAAAEILEDSAARMDEVESFRFVLEHENGRTEIVQGIEMERAEGAYVRPDRFEAEITGRAGPVSASISFVLLPEGAWMTNPLTGAWQTNNLDPAVLTRLVTEVPEVMRSVQGAEVTGTEEVDGAETFVLEATVASERLDFLAPDASAGGELLVTAWIGVDDMLLYRIEMAGPLSGQEPDNIVRRLRLSDFGADIAIEPPE